MPIFLRVDRRIWWLTVSKAADRSSKMSTEDLEAALASLRASVTESRAVSVEWPLLKPDWLLILRCPGKFVSPNIFCAFFLESLCSVSRVFHSTKKPLLTKNQVLQANAMFL